MALTFYDRDGLPIGLYQWAALLEDPANRYVRRTTITSAADLSQACDVSTIWLGIDQGWGLVTGVGPPLIFETMVFAEGNEHDRECERWPTLASAIAGHVRVVTTMVATLTDPVVMDVDPADMAVTDE